MKSGQYFVVLLIAVACGVLTVAVIVMEFTNQQLQVKLQAQQQALNQGILGQQAQQISSGVIQDLTSAAVGNFEIRQLLEKHGYRVPAYRPTGSAMNSRKKKQDESENTPVRSPQEVGMDGEETER